MNSVNGDGDGDDDCPRLRRSQSFSDLRAVSNDGCVSSTKLLCVMLDG